MSGLYFAIYLILFEDYICPFPETVGQTKFHAKKDDKVGNKTANNEERQRKKEEQGRQINVDSQQKKSKFWPVRMGEKQKAV